MIDVRRLCVLWYPAIALTHLPRYQSAYMSPHPPGQPAAQLLRVPHTPFVLVGFGCMGQRKIHKKILPVVIVLRVSQGEE